MSWDEIDLSEVDEMAIPEQELAAKLVEPGDLLSCEGGEIGRAAIWEGGRTPILPKPPSPPSPDSG